MQIEWNGGSYKLLVRMELRLDHFSSIIMIHVNLRLLDLILTILAIFGLANPWSRGHVGIDCKSETLHADYAGHRSAVLNTDIAALHAIAVQPLRIPWRQERE